MDYKKELMSFIVYPQSLESACRLLTQSKLIVLNEDNEKQRMYLSGNSIMSTKLPVGK